jgi:hypothetical protein
MVKYNLGALLVIGLCIGGLAAAIQNTINPDSVVEEKPSIQIGPVDSKGVAIGEWGSTNRAVDRFYLPKLPLIAENIYYLGNGWVRFTLDTNCLISKEHEYSQSTIKIDDDSCLITHYNTEDTQ